MTEFEAEKVAAKLRNETKTIRKQAYKNRKSCLDPFKNELLLLQQQNTTPAEMQRFLRKEKRTKVSHTTIIRYLNKINAYADIKHDDISEILE